MRRNNRAFSIFGVETLARKVMPVYVVSQTLSKSSANRWLHESFASMLCCYSESDQHDSGLRTQQTDYRLELTCGAVEDAAERAVSLQ